MYRRVLYWLSEGLFAFAVLFLGTAFCADVPTENLGEPVAQGQHFFSTGHSFHFGFPAILDEIGILATQGTK